MSSRKWRGFESRESWQLANPPFTTIPALRRPQALRRPWSKALPTPTAQGPCSLAPPRRQTGGALLGLAKLTPTVRSRQKRSQRSAQKAQRKVRVLHSREKPKKQGLL
ncbi:unnamed protein product [Lota lota]